MNFQSTANIPDRHIEGEKILALVKNSQPITNKAVEDKKKQICKSIQEVLHL